MRTLPSSSKLLLALGVLALGCATAEPPPSPELSPEQQRVERLLTQIHLPEFVGRLEEISLRAAGKPRDGHLAGDERLRPRIEAQLEPRAIVSEVAQGAAASLEPAQLAEIERFYASETGREVIEATGAPYSRLSRFGYRLFGRSLRQAPERIALVMRLDELTRTRRSAVELYLTLYESIVRWYQAHGFVDPAEAESVGGIDALIAKRRELAVAAGEEHLIPYSLWVLGDLSTPELSEYVTFMASPAAQRWTAAVREALRASIAERAEAIRR